jgi:hypothetical protein
MSLIGRNDDLARWFRDLRQRAELGRATPPPSVIDTMERLVDRAAAEQLEGAVGENERLRGGLRAALEYLELVPDDSVDYEAALIRVRSALGG